MHVGRHTKAQSAEIHSFGVHLSTHPVLHLASLQRMCRESRIKDEGIGDHQGAGQGFLFVSLSRIAPPPRLQQLIYLQ